MLTAKFHKNNVVFSMFKPVLPLVPESLSPHEVSKAEYITMDLKSKAGVKTAAENYRKNIMIFEEGSPQQ